MVGQERVDLGFAQPVCLVLTCIYRIRSGIEDRVASKYQRCLFFYHLVEIDVHPVPSCGA
jgi:hypothetical protein